MTLEEIKRRAVLRCLARHRGNKLRAVKELGISLKSLYNWLNRWASEGKVTRAWLDSINDTTATAATNTEAKTR